MRMGFSCVGDEQSSLTSIHHTWCPRLGVLGGKAWKLLLEAILGDLNQGFGDASHGAKHTMKFENDQYLKVSNVDFPHLPIDLLQVLRLCAN